jgi:hypothetical protein
MTPTILFKKKRKEKEKKREKTTANVTNGSDILQF